MFNMCVCEQLCVLSRKSKSKGVWKGRKEIMARSNCYVHKGKSLGFKASTVGCMEKLIKHSHVANETMDVGAKNS